MRSISFTLALLCAFVTAPIWLAAEPSFSMYINTSEGGEISDRRIVKLRTYLQNNQCNIQNISHGNKTVNLLSSDFIFLPLLQPDSASLKKLADIKVINNEKLSASILVRGSTGIKSVNNLDNVHIAFLSPESVTGFQLQKEVFDKANVRLNQDKITFTGSNVAAISLLLHKDVFVAGIATPLAKKWAKSNDLTIVATSTAQDAGGFWVSKQILDPAAKSCLNAFINMSNVEYKNKKLLSLFPAWIEGFQQTTQ